MSLLELPGELRNSVYEYVYDLPSAVEMVRGESEYANLLRTLRPFEALRYYNWMEKPIVKRTGVMYRILLSQLLESKKKRCVSQENTKSATSLSALLLTCRQIYHEAASLLYVRTTFFFQSSIKLQNFMARVTTGNLAFIRTLRLEYVTFGPPSESGNELWKLRHDLGWYQACNLVTANMIGLKRLCITLETFDDPLLFRFDQTWVTPLLEFRKLWDSLTDLTVELQNPYVPLSAVTIDEGSPIHVVHVTMVAFAEAIRRRILGWTEDRAMQAVDDALAICNYKWPYKAQSVQNYLR